MKIEKELTIGNRRFELTVFQKFGSVGSIIVSIPGFSVYCAAFDEEGTPLWGDFVKTPQGDPLVFETAELAFENAERLIGG